MDVQLLVLETERARNSTAEILVQHCIPAAMSSDLMEQM